MDQHSEIAQMDIFEGIAYPWPNGLKTPDLRITFDNPFQSWQRYLIFTDVLSDSSLDLDPSWEPYYPPGNHDLQSLLQEPLIGSSQSSSDPQHRLPQTLADRPKKRRVKTQFKDTRKQYPTLREICERASSMTLREESAKLPMLKKGAIKTERRAKHHTPYYFTSQEQIYVDPSALTLTPARKKVQIAPSNNTYNLRSTKKSVC